MPRIQRIGVISVFLLGAIVTIISIVRLSQLITAPTADLKCKFFDTSDFFVPRTNHIATRSWVEIDLRSAGEPVTGLLCFCLPTYAPLIRGMTKNMGLDSSQVGTGSKIKTKLTGNGTLDNGEQQIS